MLASRLVGIFSFQLVYCTVSYTDFFHTVLSVHLSVTLGFEFCYTNSVHFFESWVYSLLSPKFVAACSVVRVVRVSHDQFAFVSHLVAEIIL
jgi:hypothetical protein